MISRSLINLNNNNNNNIIIDSRFGSSSSSRLLSCIPFPVQKHQFYCFKSRRQSSSFPVVSALNSSSSSPHSYDVVVVGAGIIGLTIAHKLLLDSDLSVAVVDAALPCAGATGAGTITITPTEMWLTGLKSRDPNNISLFIYQCVLLISRPGRAQWHVSP